GQGAPGARPAPPGRRQRGAQGAPGGGREGPRAGRLCYDKSRRSLPGSAVPGRAWDRGPELIRRRFPMFAFFSLGLMEMVVLGFIGAVVVGLAAVVIVVSNKTKKRDDD